jgi:8-oxo-dGTP diphosphatase
MLVGMESQAPSQPATNPPPVRIREVAAALILRADEVLICQRKAGTPMGLQWEFPGGKLEPGETPEQALHRELQEELAIDAEIGRPLAEILHHYRNGSAIHLRFFEVRAFSGTPQNCVFEDMRWVPLRDLPTFNFLAADRTFVRDLARGAFL